MAAVDIGYLSKLFRGDINWNPFRARVVSVCKNKKTGRYFLMISDETLKKKCYLATQAQYIIQEKLVKKGDIVLLSNYSCTLMNTTNEKQKLIMIAVEVTKIENETQNTTNGKTVCQ